MKKRFAWMLAIGGAALAVHAIAAETITYVYDSDGRLTEVRRSGTVNNNKKVIYAFDNASNRTSVVATDGSNQQPIANADSGLVPCGGHNGISVFNNDSDPDSDPLTLISVSVSNGIAGDSASIASASAGIVQVNGANSLGSFTVNYTISDGRGGSANSTIAITRYSPGPQGC